MFVTRADGLRSLANSYSSLKILLRYPSRHQILSHTEGSSALLRLRSLPPPLATEAGGQGVLWFLLLPFLGRGPMTLSFLPLLTLIGHLRKWGGAGGVSQLCFWGSWEGLLESRWQAGQREVGVQRFDHRGRWAAVNLRGEPPTATSIRVETTPHTWLESCSCCLHSFLGRSPALQPSSQASGPLHHLHLSHGAPDLLVHLGVPQASLTFTSPAASVVGDAPLALQKQL